MEKQIFWKKKICSPPPLPLKKNHTHTQTHAHGSRWRLGRPLVRGAGRGLLEKHRVCIGLLYGAIPRDFTWFTCVCTVYNMYTWFSYTWWLRCSFTKTPSKQGPIGIFPTVYMATVLVRNCGWSCVHFAHYWRNWGEHVTAFVLLSIHSRVRWGVTL